MSTAGRCMAPSTSSGTVVGPGMLRNSRPAATLMSDAPPQADRSEVILQERRQVKPRRLDTFVEAHRLARGRTKHFAFPHHAAAAHESADRPAGHGHAVIRRPAAAA